MTCFRTQSLDSAESPRRSREVPFDSNFAKNCSRIATGYIHDLCESAELPLWNLNLRGMLNPLRNVGLFGEYLGFWSISWKLLMLFGGAVFRVCGVHHPQPAIFSIFLNPPDPTDQRTPTRFLHEHPGFELRRAGKPSPLGNSREKFHRTRCVNEGYKSFFLRPDATSSAPRGLLKPDASRRPEGSNTGPPIGRPAPLPRPISMPNLINAGIKIISKITIPKQRFLFHIYLAPSINGQFFGGTIKNHSDFPFHFKSTVNHNDSPVPIIPEDVPGSIHPEGQFEPIGSPGRNFTTQGVFMQMIYRVVDRETRTLAPSWVIKTRMPLSKWTGLHWHLFKFFEIVLIFKKFIIFVPILFGGAVFRVCGVHHPQPAIFSIFLNPPDPVSSSHFSRCTLNPPTLTYALCPPSSGIMNPPNLKLHSASLQN
ncbi:hypothetical protein LXL04_011985 [Taraxacum kok-saghyz]